MVGRLVLPAVLVGLAAGILLAQDAPSVVAPLAAAATGLAMAVALAALGGRAQGGALVWALASCLAAAGLLLGAARSGQAELPTGPGSVSGEVGLGTRRVEGTLVDEPRPRGDQFQVVLDGVAIGGTAGVDLPDSGGPQPVAGRLLVRLPRSHPLSAGDRIAFEAALELPEDFDGFAYRAYLERQGIGAVARAFELRLLPRSRGPADVMASLRRALLDGLNSLVPEPEAALGAGILLGVRSGMDPEVEESFAAAGLTHVVAISGWNIAIVAALTARLVTRLPRLARGRWFRALVLAATVGGYVVLTGASPSVVRAALMAGAMLVAQLFGSTAHALSTLMLAAVAMLLLAPPVLWDVGFQLSCLATGGLVVLGPSIERRLAAWPPLLREPVALTTAAQLATLPIIVGNFERLSVVAPAANVVVAPLVPIVMAASAGAALTGALDVAGLAVIGDVMAWLAGGTGWLYLRLMIAAGSLFASVPFASLAVSPPAPLLLGWYPLLAIAWRIRTARAEAAARPLPGTLGMVTLAEEAAAHAARQRKRRAMLRGLVTAVMSSGARGLTGLTVVALLATHLATLPDGRLHVTVLDVGQGDAVLVETPDGAMMLVDGGPDPERTLRRLGASLPFHRRSIDVVLLSHPHQDHVAGLVEVLRRFEVGLVMHGGRAYDNPAYATMLELAAREGDGGGDVALQALAGMRLRLDAATEVEIVYPAAEDLGEPLPDGDINNASVVAVVRFGSFSAILTGDAEDPVERELLARNAVGRAVLLKVGHHGSDSSSGADFLSVVAPLIAAISSGTGNGYGHPSLRTLAALAEVPGIRVFRTDLHGDIEVISDGRSTWVRTGRDARPTGG